MIHYPAEIEKKSKGTAKQEKHETIWGNRGKN